MYLYYYFNIRMIIHYTYVTITRIECFLARLLDMRRKIIFYRYKSNIFLRIARLNSLDCYNLLNSKCTLETDVAYNFLIVVDKKKINL